MIGGLRYLVHTRPDIAFAVGIISRFMEHPTVMHMNAAKRVLRYIKGTLDYGLVYSRENSNNVLTGYSDSDLAGNIEDRKSTGGVAFYLNDSLITWMSQKQKCVLSSCEAEFMAATAAASIDLAKNPMFHGRSKHIDIRYHFIRECVDRGEIVVKHVATENQKADIQTKALTTVKFERMRKLLGVKELTQQA
ncbi:secreted RxLR effector protein 161-like [Apium graveolens]|uniref:secreted RxLR effector protein 161-like n=1 Tax=Apium graveolens TaxID=4045 RepID=UPI003D790461